MSVLKVDVLRHRITLLRCVIVLCRCFCSQCAVHCMSLCTVMSVCYVSVLCHRVTYDIIMSLCYLILLCRLFFSAVSLFFNVLCTVLCQRDWISLCRSMSRMVSQYAIHRMSMYYVSETGYHYVLGLCRCFSDTMLFTLCCSGNCSSSSSDSLLKQIVIIFRFIFLSAINPSSSTDRIPSSVAAKYSS